MGLRNKGGFVVALLLSAMCWAAAFDKEVVDMAGIIIAGVGTVFFVGCAIAGEVQARSWEQRRARDRGHGRTG